MKQTTHAVGNALLSDKLQDSQERLNPVTVNRRSWANFFRYIYALEKKK